MEARNEDDLCLEFNKEILEIMYLVSAYNDEDVDIEYAFSLIRKFINYNPLDLLRLSHETIWEYRKEIKDSNDKFFLEEDLITKFNVKERNKKVADIDIEYIINQIKNTWSSFSPDEQKDTVNRIKHLLRLSAAYRLKSQLY